jgi:hypothetical protein
MTSFNSHEAARFQLFAPQRADQPKTAAIAWRPSAWLTAWIRPHTTRRVLSADILYSANTVGFAPRASSTRSGEMRISEIAVNGSWGAKPQGEMFMDPAAIEVLEARNRFHRGWLRLRGLQRLETTRGIIFVIAPHLKS